MPIQYSDKIKRPGSLTSFTAPMICELKKCSRDVIYFAENYYYIVHPVKGKQKIKLFDAQKKLLRHFSKNRFSIILSSRQIGKTTCSCIFLLWMAIFHLDKTYAILANKDRTAISILKDIKLAYENLPSWIKPGVMEYNEHTIKLDNGSIIFSAPTSSDALRGESISLLFLDEFAFVKKHIADAFWASNYPVISAGGNIIIVSTPNGISNLFHEIWTKARRSENNFAPLRVDWWEVPGRNSEWRESTIKDIGPVRFNQEYDNQFVGSQYTLIDAEKLRKLSFKDPISGSFFFNQYEDRKKDGIYVAGIDTGKGVRNDSSVIQICRVINKDKLKQVAVYRRNDMDIFDFSEEVYNLATAWNEAFINVENNGLGEVVINKLWHEFEYVNVFYDRPQLQVGKRTRRKATIGTNANGATKKIMTSILKRYIENNMIEICDRVTVSELSSFIDRGDERYSADDGAHDDTVTSLGWLLYMFDNPWYQDILDYENIQTEEDEEMIRKVRNSRDDEKSMPDPEKFLPGDTSGLFSGEKWQEIVG